MLYFLVGIVVGAVAIFFVVKNNLARANAAWLKADELNVKAKALEIKVADIVKAYIQDKL